MSINKHLAEQDLIEFQFKLAPDEKVKEIASHLDSCNQCREQLEKLKRKFAALDLLKADIKVPRELAAKVVQQTRKPAKAKIFSLTKSTWFSAAAVLVLGILFISTLDREREIDKDLQVVDEGIQQQEVRTSGDVPPEIDGLSTFSTDRGRQSIDQRTVAVAPEGSRNGELLSGFAADSFSARDKSAITMQEMSAEESIGEQPYFAPASAIELNVLPKRENVQLTIYNSADLTLVRERRNLTLKRGWNWLQFMWANTLIDATSLDMEPLEQKDQIDIQALVFPARLRQIGRWLIRSEVSGQVPFEITYLTSGLSWRAFYMGTLSEDETSMQMKGYVRVSNNSGEDYADAQTRLIVGQVHMLDEIAALAQRQYPYGSPIPIEALWKSYSTVVDYGWEGEVKKEAELGDIPQKEMLFGDTLSIKEIIKEGLSEYFLYTIEGTETIENQWSKRLLSFEAEDIEIESLYKYDEGRYGNQTIRFVKFANDEEHNLGETPIPDGNVKIYGLADESGFLSYVGGTNIKYIPVNEEVELDLGPARLVEVEPTLMDFETDNYMFDPNDNSISGWDEIRLWKIEITNTRQIPVSIEITRDFGTNFWVVQSETPYEKHDITRIRFNLDIEAETKREIEYTVITFHGERQDGFIQ